MALRFTFAALATCTLAACAAGGSDDPAGEIFDDGGIVEGGHTIKVDAGPTGTGPGGPTGSTGATGSTGSTGATGSTGPGVFDSGGPATVGGDDAGGHDDDAGDAGTTDPDSGGVEPGGGCTTLSQCPYGSATEVAAVACEDGGCIITCTGENYDVNGTLSDGCEIPQTCPQSNGSNICPTSGTDDHIQANAAYVGSFSCTDSDSAQDLTGILPSDARGHTPAVDGFVVATGSAPAFFSIYGSGGTFCEDDANFALSMTAPTSQMACYTMTLITSNQTQTCTTDGTGTCSISNGSGSYGDGTYLYVEISKDASCAASTTKDDGTFKITGHL